MKIATGQSTVSGDLPSADQGVDQAADVAGDRLVFSDWDIHQKVPVHPVLGNPCVAPVEQQAVAGGILGWNGAGQVVTGGAQNVVPPPVACHPHGVAHHVEHLERVPLRVTMLEFQLDAVEVGPAGLLVALHGPVHLLIVRPARHVREFAGRERKASSGVPDVGGRRIVVRIPLRHACAVRADVTQLHNRVGEHFALHQDVPLVCPSGRLIRIEKVHAATPSRDAADPCGIQRVTAIDTCDYGRHGSQQVIR